MPYLILLLTALLTIIVLLIVNKLTWEKYDNFVLKNSDRLKRLYNLNGRYKFFDHVDFNQSHTYDNEHFYEDISCSDYLIYQLQFIGPKVIEQINREKKNQQLYEEYLAELNALTVKGVFFSETGKLKYNKLLISEEKLFLKYTLPKPHTNFIIRVTLYCSTINGRIYDRKTKFFKSEDIIGLIKRLRNRNGTFYNDREIWNSISRVERGKVSNKIRFAIYERDGYRCRKCGASQAYTMLEIDHIIPIAKGGKSTYNNLQTLCHKCNANKGDRLDF